MPANASIRNTATDLEVYARTYDPEIRQALRTGLEFENNPNVAPRAADKVFVAPSVSTTELLQPWQNAWTPKGSYEFDAVPNELRPIKLDHTVTSEDLEVFWTSWMIEWFEAGKDPNTWNFPRYLFDTVFLPKITEELNEMAWKGVYAAPTPGTAGGYLTSVDGYHEKIKDAVIAGDLTEYSTGALLESTMVAQIEEWIDSIPVPYRDAPGVIFMSQSNKRKYQRNYRSEFKYNAELATEQLRVDATNKTIIGINAMEGSDRIMFSPAVSRNMVWVTRIGRPTYFNLTFEQEKRSVHMFGEIFRAFGFNFWEHLFVNDQE